ncbi:MAG: cytochrome b [Pseudomonadota bacterium]
MLLKNTEQRWGLVAQLFHWSMFLLIAGAWFAVESHEDFPKGSAERAEWMALHKALGVTIFALVWFRLAARLTQSSPAPSGAAWQRRLAWATHAALYLLMILMPLTGLLASQFGGKPVAWFGLFEIPVWVTEDRERAKQIMEVHEAGWSLLLTLIVLHAGAALYHQLVLKDGLLRRMLP